MCLCMRVGTWYVRRCKGPKPPFLQTIDSDPRVRYTTFQEAFGWTAAIILIQHNIPNIFIHTIKAQSISFITPQKNLKHEKKKKKNTCEV